MKNQKYLGIVALFIAAIGVAYFVGQNSHTPTPTPQNSEQATSSTNQSSNVQLPVASQPQTPVNNNAPKNNNVDETRLCAQQAAIVAKNDEAFGAAHGAPLGPGFSYQSHYNSTLGKCLYLSTDVGTFNNNGVLDEVLSDAYDNTTIASYYDEISPTNVIVTEVCNINGVMGCTNKQFRAFLNVEMESTMY